MEKRSFIQKKRKAPDEMLEEKSQAKRGPSFAERMMAKQGWTKGSGLGQTGQGRVAPIEVTLRPTGVGLGAVKEKNASVKAEERRQKELRGEKYEDDSEEERKQRKKAKKVASVSSSGASTPNPRLKTKYAIDSLEQQYGVAVPESLKFIDAATGAESSVLSLRGPAFQKEGDRLSDIAVKIARDLQSYADAFRSTQDEQDLLEIEDRNLKLELERLEDDLSIRRDIAIAVAELGADHTASSFEATVTALESIQSRFNDDIESFGLQEIAVSALKPFIESHVRAWQPLEQPNHILEQLLRLQSILGIHATRPAQKGSELISLVGDTHFHPARKGKKSTPFETMMHTLWEPKIRRAITAYDVSEPDDLLAFTQAWRPVTPRFINKHIIRQIAQKLSTAVADWNPRMSVKRNNTSTPLYYVLPWLELLDADVNMASSLLGDLKRKFKLLLGIWPLSRGIIPGLALWRDVLGKQAFNGILVGHIIPRLSASLSSDEGFVLDPSDLQPAMQNLQRVLEWKAVLKPEFMGEILLSNFFVQLQDVLHLWLTNSPNFSEVGEFYAYMKDQIGEDISSVPAVAAEWDRALGLINQALDLGPEHVVDLPKPGLRQPSPGTSQPTKGSSSKPKEVIEETTFKEVVESWAEAENLLVVNLREAHDQTGLPLFKITASSNGKGGVRAFIKGDVLYLQSKKDRNLWEPAGLGENLVARAEGK